MVDVSSGRSLAGKNSGRARSEQIGPETDEGFDFGVGVAAGVGLHGAGLEVGVNHSLMTGKTEFEHTISAPGVSTDPIAKTAEPSLEHYNVVGGGVSLGRHAATIQIGVGIGEESPAGEAEAKAYGYVKAPYELLEAIGAAFVGALNDTAYLGALDPNTFGAADPAYSGPFNLDLAINPPTPDSIGSISFTQVDPVPPTPITPFDGASWDFGFMPNVPDVPVACIPTPRTAEFARARGRLLMYDAALGQAAC